MGVSNFYEKETKKFTGTIKVDGTAQDITSDTVTFYLMTKPNETPTLTKQADVSLGSGQYEVTLTTTDTAVTPRLYYYEIWWVLSSGEEYVLESGQVNIKDSYYKTTS
jgi:hypothetical protein